jgi:hypothetical protein
MKSPMSTICEQPDDSSHAIPCMHGGSMLKPYVPCKGAPRKDEQFAIIVESDECFELSRESSAWRAQYNRIIGMLIQTELSDYEIPVM